MIRLELGLLLVIPLLAVLMARGIGMPLSLYRMHEAVCMSRLMTPETWARHANPWSGWTRVLTYPLLYVPIWLHNWYLLILVAIWFAVNPRLFPKPRSTDNWMSKGVLGEQLWTQRWRWDFPMMLGIVAVPCFIGAVYTAYMRMFWALLFFASNVLVLKLWFVDRMVRFYEDKKPTEETTRGSSKVP